MTHYYEHPNPRIAIHFEDGRNAGVSGVCKVLRLTASGLHEANRLHTMRPYTPEEVAFMLEEFADRIEGRLVGPR